MTAITTVISDDIYKDLKNISAQFNITQRNIIEEGLIYITKQYKKKMFERELLGYKKFLKNSTEADEEIKFLTDAGLEDFRYK